MKTKNKSDFNSPGYKKAISDLIKLGFKVEDITEVAQIYYEMNSKSRTRISAVTFMIKLKEFMEFIVCKRDRGLTRKDEGYIGIKGAIEMIKKNLKLLASDFKEQVEVKFDLIDSFSWTTQVKTNSIFMSNEFLGSTSNEKLFKQNEVLSQFEIILEDGSLNLSEYVFTQNKQQLQTSAEKMFFRLMHLVDIGEIVNNQLSKNTFNRAMKSKAAFEKMYKVEDDELAIRYQLPKFDSDDPQRFKNDLLEAMSFYSNDSRGER